MPSLFNRKNRHGGGLGSDNFDATTTGTDNNFDNQVRQLIPAEVIMISGCHSLETSADVSNVKTIDGHLPSPEGRAGGACTTALLSILYESLKTTDRNNSPREISFQQLLLRLRGRLAQSGMSQIPQLTSSRPLELEERPFSLKSNNPNGGTQRALLVGINYYGQSGQLSGCINDVLNVKKYLCNHHGFLEKHVLLLIDDGRNHKPTRENIIRALRRLVEHSKAGDSVYFHYSGHGGLLDPDYWNRYKAGKKDKQYDETLYPVDHARTGQIRDFSLFNHFVKPMTAGVTVTCVMDCCHSGSVLDLPYSYRPTEDGTIRMRQSMDSLTNLSFLYILAGGMLPDFGFESIAENLQSATGETMDALQGTGVEEFSSDLDGGINGYGLGNGDDVDDAMNYTSGLETGNVDTGFDDSNVDYGGNGVDDFDLQNTDIAENAYGDGDRGDAFFGAFRDTYFADETVGDADCGDVNCGDADCNDGCDVVGAILGALMDSDS